jgi:hypothetical protein
MTSIPTTSSRPAQSCDISSTSSGPDTPASPQPASSTGQPLALDSAKQARKAIGSIYFAGIQLSSLDAEIGSLAEMLEDEDPDVVAQATADLEELLAAQEEGSAMLVDRCDRALAIADVLIGQSSARRAMAKRLTALAQADELRVERLQEAAIKMVRLAHPNQKNISLPMHELKSRPSVAVAIDEDLVSPTDENFPEDLVRVKKEFDKTAIKAFLKAGGVIEGLSLEKRINWNVASS